VQAALAELGFEARTIPPVRGEARLSDHSVLDVQHTDSEVCEVVQLVLGEDPQAAPAA